MMFDHKRTARLLTCTLLSAAVAWLACPSPSMAQFENRLETRFGLGFNTVLSVDNGFGLGFRGRVSTPVNQDFSLAIGMGFTGFVLRGRDESSFVFDPQLSGIINIPQRGSPAQVYLLAGVGGYIPLSSASTNESGPSIHFGIGRVEPLSQSSFYYEMNPAVIIGETRVNFVLPFRVGIIFGGS